MKSNYKPIGAYIQLVDERNINLNVKTLLGLSITKQFIPSVANIIGTDMMNYKIIRKNQFACSTMQVRRDKKMPIALLSNYDEAIISAAYPVFEVIDTKIILPEYLMMWFSRSEFDREACFYAVGGVRGSIEWEDFCNMKLPVPSLTKQKEIIREYNIIVKRINLNNQFIQKLEETALTIYKQWFVDFEFPDENGNPYKSSGGEMVFREEIEKEIPKGWDIVALGTLVECNYATLKLPCKFKTIEYLDTSNITNNEIESVQNLNLKADILPSRARRRVSHKDIIFSTVRPNLRHFGIIKTPKENMIVSTGFAVLKVISSKISVELIYLFITNDACLQELQSKAEMSVSTYPSIKPEDLLNMMIPLNEKHTLNLSKLFIPLFEKLDILKKQNKSLNIIKELLLTNIAVISNFQEKETNAELSFN